MSIRSRIHKPFAALCIACIGMQFMHCGLVEDEIYEPVVVFRGIIDDKFATQQDVELPGNIRNPNTCQLIKDTLRIYCRSADFFKGGGDVLWDGDELRIDIYPFEWDSDSTNALGIEHFLIDYNRWRDEDIEGASRFFIIVPGDTAFGPEWIVYAKAEKFRRRRGGKIHLTFDYVPMHFNGKNAVTLEITNAELIGVIE